MKSITFASLWILISFLPNTEANQANCSVVGDSHYTTFDGKKYKFTGLCEYVFAKDTDNTFTVLVKNKPCGSSTRSVTCTYAVRVKVKGLNIRIRRGGRVQMSGVNIKLPYIIEGVSIVKTHGRMIRITTDIGLSIEYNGVYNVYVIVNGIYKGKTLGLCGTFNGNKKDDFKKRDNEVSTSAQAFGISWNVNKHCHDTDPLANPCNTAGGEAQRAKTECMTTFGRNPFKECNTRVPVDSGFIQDCKYAVCACYDHPLSCLCEEYDDYVTSCSLAGIKIQWRDRRQFKNCLTPCANDPCLNGGTCKNNGKSYKCSCPSGFLGLRCQDKWTCAQHGCMNAGTCKMDGQCQCHSGFEGRQCEVEMTPCAKDPCLNGGTCKNDGKSYKCLCPSGFLGLRCQAKWCAQNECKNFGTCQNNGTCHCRAGFMGRQCEIEVTPCANDPCLNGGTCKNAGKSYKCLCPSGFLGPRCKDKWTCAQNECMNLGTCQNDGTCHCRAGYMGRQCEID